MITITRILLVIGCFLFLSDMAMAAGQPQTRPTSLTVGQVLHEFSSRLGVQFTLEEDARDPARPSALRTAMLPKPEGVDNPADAIRYLEGAMPSIVADQDRVKPNLIHLADRALSGVRGYPMDSAISITFAGEASGMVRSLHAATGGRIREPNVFYSDDPTPWVDHTPVDVRCSQMHVRELLSRFLPLDRYAPIVWEASLGKEKEGEIVALRLRPLSAVKSSSASSATRAGGNTTGGGNVVLPWEPATQPTPKE